MRGGIVRGGIVRGKWRLETVGEESSESEGEDIKKKSRTNIDASLSPAYHGNRSTHESVTTTCLSDSHYPGTHHINVI